jgi:hypothetical protein
MNIVEPKRRGGMGVVLAIVALDFAGIGLTLPIIPRLLSDVAHTADLGWRFGAFLSLYALMQFVFSPILGIGAIESVDGRFSCAHSPAPPSTTFSWQWLLL